jgi:NAD+ synthase
MSLHALGCWCLARFRARSDRGNSFDRAAVSRVQRLLYSAGYKRRQAPPGVKITHKSFGRDRRYPMTNAFGE